MWFSNYSKCHRIISKNKQNKNEEDDQNGDNGDNDETYSNTQIFPYRNFHFTVGNNLTIAYIITHVTDRWIQLWKWTHIFFSHKNTHKKYGKRKTMQIKSHNPILSEIEMELRQIRTNGKKWFNLKRIIAMNISRTLFLLLNILSETLKLSHCHGKIRIDASVCVCMFVCSCAIKRGIYSSLSVVSDSFSYVLIILFA